MVETVIPDSVVTVLRDYSGSSMEIKWDDIQLYGVNIDTIYLSKISPCKS